MADIAASVLARLKIKAAERWKKLSTLFTAFLPRGIFAAFGKVRVC